MRETDPGADPADRPRRHRIRALALAAATALLIVVALAAIDLYRIRADLADAQDALAGASIGDVRTAGGVEPIVAAASRSAGEADARATSSPWLRIAGHVPFLDRQVDGVRDLTAAAHRLTDVALARSTELDEILDRPVGTGSRTQLLADLARLADGAERDLASIEIPGAQGLAGPLADAHDRLVAGVLEATGDLRDGRATLRALREVLRGPGRYLVLAANNAEMRGGGGMPLHVGVLEIDHGAFEASRFRPTSELLLDEAVAVPPSIEELYGWLGPGREWRNTATSPNFPAIAPVYRRLAAAAGLGPVDGVIQIDVVALAGLLDALGPVHLGDQTFTAASLPRVLLHDLYLHFDWRNDERHALLGKIAASTLRQLDRRSWDPLDVADALGDAAAGRHLLVWSARRSEQRAWRTLGLTGALDPRGVLVAVQNHSGNKLDWYLEPEITVDAGAVRGAWRDVEVRLELRNTAPPGLPGSIAGDGHHGRPGTYSAFVTAYLPEDARDADIDGAALRVVGRDGPMHVLGATLSLRPGTTREIVIRFRTAADQPLVLLPSARVRPVPVRVGSITTDDSRDVRIFR